jgi:hypothetical protein
MELEFGAEHGRMTGLLVVLEAAGAVFRLLQRLLCYSYLHQLPLPPWGV